MSITTENKTRLTLSLVDKAAQHLTATEIKAIRWMLESGYTSCHNRPKTKIYTVMAGSQEDSLKDEWLYTIRISTYATVNIGFGPEWRNRSVQITTKSA